MASGFARLSVAAVVTISAAAAVMAAASADGRPRAYRAAAVPAVTRGFRWKPSAPESVPTAGGKGRRLGPWPSSGYHRSGHAAERSADGGRRPRPEPPQTTGADVAAARVPYVSDDGSYRLGGGHSKPKNATARTDATTVETRAKLETTTHGRSIITAPLKMCPEGQRMYPDRTCGPNFGDPENEKK